MAETTEPEAKWNALRENFLSQIQLIDRETQGSTVEPEWWLDMMSVARIVRQTAGSPEQVAASSDREAGSAS